MQPATRYVSVDGARVAFQAFGDGPTTLLISAGSFSHTDVVWEDPATALFLTRLGSFTRVIRYDRLGVSNSDPLPAGWTPSHDAFRAELEAVADAAGADEFVLMAMLDAGPFAIRYAAEHPARVERLVLYNTTARVTATDGYPEGVPAEVMDDLLAHIDLEWGSTAQVLWNVPSRAADDRFAAWYAKYVRSLGTPTTIIGLLRHHVGIDVRADLPSVAVPTLVIQRAGYVVIPAPQGRYLAAHIPGARYVELPGSDGPMFWETPDLVLDTLREFVATGTAAETRAEIATILFTDIVRSTERAESLGDRDWSAVVAAHREVTTGAVEGRGGRVVKWTGDGVLALFDHPDAAVACATDLSLRARSMGVPVRCGLHTGRVERTADDVTGLAVHIAARVMHAAGADEIVVSRTVHDLMLGTDHPFRDLGRHTLKGVDGEWELYALDA